MRSAGPLHEFVVIVEVLVSRWDPKALSYGSGSETDGGRPRNLVGWMVGLQCLTHLTSFVDAGHQIMDEWKIRGIDPAREASKTCKEVPSNG